MKFDALSLAAGLHIRPSDTGDQLFFKQLYKSTRSDLDLIEADQDFIEELKNNQYEAQTASYAENFPNAMSLVIEYHRQKVGRAILDFGHNEILLIDISFTPNARGKGLGSDVLRSFIHIAEQTHIPLTLSVLEENVMAKEFYKRLGFVHLEYHYPREYLAYYPSNQKIRVAG